MFFFLNELLSTLTNWEKVKNLNYVIYTYNLLIGDEYDDSFSFIISEYSSEKI